MVKGGPQAVYRTNIVSPLVTEKIKTLKEVKGCLMTLEIISDTYYFLKSAILGIQKYMSIIYKYIQEY